MKTFLLLFTLILFSCSDKAKVTVKVQDQPEDIVNSFTAFKTAVMESNGEKAYEIVDKNTRDYYDRIYKVIMEYNQEQLKQLTLGEKLQVLTYRHRIPQQTLKKLSGKKLFIHIFNEGWSVDEVKVIYSDKVQIKGETASMSAKANGKKISLVYKFNKESDAWKMDLAAVNKNAEGYINATFKNTGLSEREFLFKVIGMSNGKPVSETVYRPANSPSK